MSHEHFDVDGRTRAINNSTVSHNHCANQDKTPPAVAKTIYFFKPFVRLSSHGGRRVVERASGRTMSPHELEGEDTGMSSNCKCECRNRVSDLLV